MAQFEMANTKFGAPMGRAEWGEAPTDARSVRVFKVNVDAGGYDDGGAYWGLGKPLYCATDGKNYRMFCRADSRLRAVCEFRIALYLIKKPPIAEYARLRDFEKRGVLGASGVILRQKLDELGFDTVGV